MKKLILISHSITGDRISIIESIMGCAREIHLLLNGTVIPVTPYVTALQYLDVNSAYEFKFMRDGANSLISRRMVDEVWVTGPLLSENVKLDIAAAQLLNIPVHRYESKQFPCFVEEELKNYLEQLKKPQFTFELE